MTYVKVVEQIASHDASTGWCVDQANGCSMVAAFLDPDIAQKSLDRLMGSSPGDRSSRAECQHVPGGFRLTGAGTLRAAAIMRAGSAPMS